MGGKDFEVYLLGRNVRIPLKDGTYAIGRWNSIFLDYEEGIITLNIGGRGYSPTQFVEGVLLEGTKPRIRVNRKLIANAPKTLKPKEINQKGKCGRRK